VRQTLRLSALVLVAAIALAALLLGGCGGGIEDDIIVPVLMKDNDTFSPRAIAAAPGAVVRWTNEDTQHHSAIADPDNPVPGGPDSDMRIPLGLVKGQAFEWRVPWDAASGTVWYYHCRFRGTAGNGTSFGTGMVGKITVP